MRQPFLAEPSMRKHDKHDSRHSGRHRNIETETVDAQTRQTRFATQWSTGATRPSATLTEADQGSMTNKGLSNKKINKNSQQTIVSEMLHIKI